MKTHTINLGTVMLSAILFLGSAFHAEANRIAIGTEKQKTDLTKRKKNAKFHCGDM